MSQIDHPILNLFTELLAEPSPSGYEDRVAALIVQKTAEWGYSSTIDPAGNVLVHVPSEHEEKPLICYAAHMDEIGFMITRVEGDGRLRATRHGGLLPWKAGEGPVELLSRDGKVIPGVLSFGSTHGQADAPTWETAAIVTGYSVQALEELGIGSGTPGVIARHVCQPVVLGPEKDPLIGCWTFDDRLGCAIMLYLLQQMAELGIQPASPTLFAFTTREEVGGYGARYVAATHQPEIFVAVDGSPITSEVNLSMDGRPVIWSKDRLAPYSAQLVNEFLRLGREKGIGVQTVAYSTNASDASMALTTGHVGKIVCFGHPRENSHGFEITRLSVMDHVHEILLAFITSYS